jgi:nucleotide-binding universal stress UspA family protein
MKILVALDRSEYAEIVLEHALDRAVQDQAGDLHVATAVSDERDIDAARDSLAMITRDALDAFGEARRSFAVHVVSGPPASAISALAQQIGADLLVVGRFHVPSESETFVSLAPCATLVVGPDGIELEPQCRACEEVRRRTDAEQLFCTQHAGDRVPELVTRIPVTDIRRLWLL